MWVGECGWKLCIDNNLMTLYWSVFDPLGKFMNLPHAFWYLILIHIFRYVIYPFTLQIDINVHFKSHSYLISFSINLQPWWIYEAFTQFLESSATMKQHIVLKDYKYDLGSLFKDHKTSQLNWEWRQDLNWN